MCEILDTKILKMSDLLRYNGRYKIKNESISEHSFYVAYNVMNICKKYSVSIMDKCKALEFAIVHDIPELYTNDINYITKRDNPELAKILDNIERDFISNEMPLIKDAFIEFQNDKNSIPHIIVKLADSLSVLQFASREINLGNTSKDMREIESESSNRVNLFENMLIEKLKNCP